MSYNNQISANFDPSLYQGGWDADTNTPTITSGVGIQGHYYIVTVPGNTTIDGHTDWHIGDWIVFNGLIWDKVDMPAETLNALEDVEAPTPAGGDILRYDFGDSRWKNQPFPVVTITETRLLFVDKNGDDSDDGSINSPMFTINAAIAKAKTLTPIPSTSNSVAIIVNPGIYDEEVLLDYTGINLYGYGQGITRIERAGTALRIEDNGVDPEPWDLKIVGISVKSSTSDYSVTITGIAGSSIGGNKIQFRDCRLEGSNSIHTYILNYLDFQNTYIMGAQLYEQTSGIWEEDSESAGGITVDWDNAGLKPSDTGHYGVNFMRHFPRGVITLLNSGIIGEDYRATPASWDKNGDIITQFFPGDKIDLTADSSAPAAPASDTIRTYVRASGTSPNREIAYCIKDEAGQEVILHSVLV